MLVSISGRSSWRQEIITKIVCKLFFKTGEIYIVKLVLTTIPMGLALERVEEFCYHFLSYCEMCRWHDKSKSSVSFVS